MIERCFAVLPVQRKFNPAIPLKRRNKPLPDTEDNVLTAFLTPIVEDILSDSEFPHPPCPNCGGMRIYPVHRKSSSRTALPVFGCRACNRQFRRTLNTPLHGIVRKDRVSRFIRLLSQQRSFLNASQILDVDYRILQVWTARFREWLLELDPSGTMEVRVRLGMMPNLSTLVCPACQSTGGLVHFGFSRGRKKTSRVSRRFQCSGCSTLIAVDEASLLITVEDGVRGRRTEVKPASGCGQPLLPRRKRRSIGELEPEIVKRRKAGETFAAIASELAIDRETVSSVVRYYEGLANGTVTGPRRHPGSKLLLTQVQRDEIRQRRQDGEKLKALADAFGVSIGLVHKVAKTQPQFTM